MARTSTTELAVLGALSIEPMSGYALRRAITETLGHFWSESYGQIYPALAALEAAGSVRRASPGRTSGRRFEITDLGREQLHLLLAEPFERLPPRNGLLLRLFFGRRLGDDGCRTLLTEALAEAEAALSGYQRIRAEVEAERDAAARLDDGTQHFTYWLITVAAGEHHARAQISWATQSLGLLDRAEDPAQP